MLFPVNFIIKCYIYFIVVLIALNYIFDVALCILCILHGLGGFETISDVQVI